MAIKNGTPAGHNTITAHVVSKDASAAIDFYKNALGAEEEYRLSMPDGKVAHANLRFGQSVVWIGDENEMQGLKAVAGANNVTLNLFVEDCDKVFARAVAAGAKAIMPPMDMFWGARYGQILDPFGQKWAIATQKREVTPAEMMEAMKTMAASAPGAVGTAQSIHQEVVFNAPPSRIYAVLTDGKRFSAMTGDKPAEIRDEAGTAFTCFGGMIQGQNVELVRDQRVVQAWRAKPWEAGVYSLVRFELIAEGKGTRVKFDHTGFPAGQGDHLATGWTSNYWEPLHKYLAAQAAR